MGRRKLTIAEIVAYDELARAAAKLRDAQAEADAAEDDQPQQTRDRGDREAAHA